VPGEQVKLALHEAVVGASDSADLRDRHDGTGGAERFPRPQLLVVLEKFRYTVIFEMEWIVAWHRRIIPVSH
jgi:hypothetical protein